MLMGWVHAKWCYWRNDAYTRELAQKPGMATQCPQNQPLRTSPIMPCRFNEHYFQHFQRNLAYIRGRISGTLPQAWFPDWIKPTRKPRPTIQPKPKPKPEPAPEPRREIQPKDIDGFFPFPLLVDWSTTIRSSPMLTTESRTGREKYLALVPRWEKTDEDEDMDHYKAYTRQPAIVEIQLAKREVCYDWIPFHQRDEWKNRPLRPLCPSYIPHWRDTKAVVDPYNGLYFGPNEAFEKNISYNVNWSLQYYWPCNTAIPFQLCVDQDTWEFKPFRDILNQDPWEEISPKTRYPTTEMLTWYTKYSGFEHERDRPIKGRSRVGNTIFSLIGPLEYRTAPPNLQDRENFDVIRQSDFPIHMYNSGMCWELLRPNYHILSKTRVPSAEQAINHTLRQLRDLGITIVGFFDVNIGRRVTPCHPSVGSHQETYGALEMSFAPAIRKWFGNDERGKPHDIHPKWKMDDSLEREVRPHFRPKQEAAHWSIVDTQNWDQQTFQETMKTENKIKQIFLEMYEREEYNFHWVHQIPFFPEYKVWDGKPVPAKSQRPHNYEPGIRLKDPNTRATTFVSLRSALPQIQGLIQETIRLSGHATIRGCAIAVPDPTAAEYLRDAVGFNGIIINLQCLDYPGLDNFPAWYVSRFCECGRDTHMPSVTVKDPENMWNPIRIKRPEGDCGYLKCTYRTVQMMRHWTEMWYPVIVNQKGLNERTDTSTFNSEKWYEFWRTYMAMRIRELQEELPNGAKFDGIPVGKNYWYRKPRDHPTELPPNEEYRQEMSAQPTIQPTTAPDTTVQKP